MPKIVITRWKFGEPFNIYSGKKLRKDLLQKLGINMKFELEGNAARAIFREDNHDKSISLVTANDPLIDTIKPKKISRVGKK